MTSRRLFYILLALLVITSAGGLVGVYYGNSHLKKESQKLLALKAENAAIQEQQTNLAQAKRDIAKYSDLEKIVKTIVPQEKDQARTVRELVKLAEQSGISLGTVSFPSSTLGEAVKTTTPTTSQSTASGTATATSAAPKTTQVKPVEGINGLYQMEISVQSASDVSYTQLLDFLSRLEQNRRTAQVTSITIDPVPTNRSLVTFSLIINVYIKA